MNLGVNLLLFGDAPTPAVLRRFALHVAHHLLFHHFARGFCHKAWRNNSQRACRLPCPVRKGACKIGCMASICGMRGVRIHQGIPLR